MGVRGAASKIGRSSTVQIFANVPTALAVTLWLGNPCFAQSSFLLSYSEISAAANKRELATWLGDDELRHLARATPVWEQASSRAENHPADTVGRPVLGAMITPIPAARHGFGHYTGLRLTATDVLLRGDSLTLRAGSDLHLLLQGIGFADWVGDAGALVGWMSRAELRWARPTTLGEFSLACHVDRKGDEFRHGQVQAVWQVRF
jgi:hypothetical protein